MSEPKRVVLIVDLDGAEAKAAVSMLQNPQDSDNLMVTPISVGRSLGDILRAIEQAALLAQGREREIIPTAPD